MRINIFKTKIFSSIFFSTSLILALFYRLLYSFKVFAHTAPQLGGSSCNLQGTSCTITSPFGSSITNIVPTLFNIFYFIVGFVFFVLIIVSGIRIITANGDRSRLEKAKTMLLYAVIGFVVILSAGIIVRIFSTLFPIFNGLL